MANNIAANAMTLIKVSKFQDYVALTHIRTVDKIKNEFRERLPLLFFFSGYTIIASDMQTSFMGVGQVPFRLRERAQ